MASRFYFDNTSLAGTSSTFDSHWNEDLRTAASVQTLLAGTTGNNGFNYQKKQAAANGNFTLHSMFQYSIPAGLLMTGNIRGELVGARDPSGSQLGPAIAVNIRNASDVIVAHLIQYFPAPSNLYPNSPNGAVFPTPPSTAIIDAGYVTQVGDKLVVEVGCGWLVASSLCGPIIGGLLANTDWSPGDFNLPGANPQVKNPWIEFETTLAPATEVDDYLWTLSGSSTAVRPATPSKFGLHFFARDTDVLSIWDGNAWKDMVASLNANGGTSIGGNITFNNTTSVNVGLSGSTFTWTQNYAAPSGGYATAATAGTPGTTSIASDAVFVFPEALATLANRTKTITLTDDPTFGATLTPAGVWTQNFLSLLAPTGTFPFGISTFGTIAIAGSTPNTLVGIVGGIVQSTSGVLTAWQSTTSNTNTTTGSVLGQTASLNTRGSGGIVGSDFVMTRTVTTATGAATGHRVRWQDVSTAASRGDIVGYTFESSASSINSTFTNAVGLKVLSPTLGIGMSIASYLGTDIQNLFVAGKTTNAWSHRGANKFDCTVSDFIASGTNTGFITRDSQGGINKRRWRMRMNTSSDPTVFGFTMSVNAFGVAAFTRAGGGAATGNSDFTVDDVGTSDPVS